MHTDRFGKGKSQSEREENEEDDDDERKWDESFGAKHARHQEWHVKPDEMIRQG